MLNRLVNWALSALEEGLQTGDEADLAAAIEAARLLGRPEVATLAKGLAAAWEEVGHGHWADAERLYELAASTSNDAAPAIAGAELAWSRCHGDKAVALFRLAAELALANGDVASEARASAGASEVMNRYGATMRQIPPAEATAALVDRSEAAAKAAGDNCSLARAAVARMWFARRGEDVHEIEQRTSLAVRAAQSCADPAVLSSALDGLTGVALRDLRTAEARAIIEERLRVNRQFWRPGRSAGARADRRTIYGLRRLVPNGGFPQDALTGPGAARAGGGTGRFLWRPDTSRSGQFLPWPFRQMPRTSLGCLLGGHPAAGRRDLAVNASFFLRRRRVATAVMTRTRAAGSPGPKSWRAARAAPRSTTSSSS